MGHCFFTFDSAPFLCFCDIGVKKHKKVDSKTYTSFIKHIKKIDQKGERNTLMLLSHIKLLSSFSFSLYLLFRLFFVVYSTLPCKSQVSVAAWLTDFLMYINYAISK